MAEKHVEEVEVNKSFEQVKGFWEKNKNVIMGIAATIIIVGGGWILYKNYVVVPKEEKASEAMFKAEEFFRNDSLNLALNGDGQNKGFLYISKNYGGTKAANLAHFYAGVIYLQQNDFANAIKHLKDFSTDAKQIQMIAYARLGDAYSEQGKTEEAIDYYKKAGHYFPKDEAGSTEYLFRAGALLEDKGKPKEALELYKEIKEKYPKSEKGFSIDKYIYRLSIEKNDFSIK